MGLPKINGIDPQAWLTDILAPHRRPSDSSAGTSNVAEGASCPYGAICWMISDTSGPIDHELRYRLSVCNKELPMRE